MQLVFVVVNIAADNLSVRHSYSSFLPFLPASSLITAQFMTFTISIYHETAKLNF